jgi:hypothetical protein
MEGKYIQLANINDLKNRTFNDKVYYTLRDIYWNCNNELDCEITKSFNVVLKNDYGGYSNILYENNFGYSRKLITYLKQLTTDRLSLFDGVHEEEPDSVFYLPFDTWGTQLQILISLLEHLENTKINNSLILDCT